MQHGPESKCVESENGQGRDPQVVIACDRCDDEVRLGYEVDLAPLRERAAQYATLSIGSLVSQPKVLRLCPECVRAFRLFLLGAAASEIRIGERWESVVSGAV
jgi:hypothetical protein